MTFTADERQTIERTGEVITTLAELLQCQGLSDDVLTGIVRVVEVAVTELGILCDTAEAREVTHGHV